MATIAERIKQGMEIRGLKQADIVERSGINKGALSCYISGKYKPKQNGIYLIAKALDVSEAWLMGADVPMEKTDFNSTYLPPYSNIHPIATRRFPVLSSVACGEPILMQEEREVYVDASVNIKADFVLIAKGDSMTGARIYDGDIVFIRQQPEVENGEIAAVGIGDEATLKRVFWYANKTLLVLRAENPEYKDMEFSGDALKDVRIFGKAVAFQSDVR